MIPSAKPATIAQTPTSGTTAKPASKPSRLCDHIFTNGEKCESLSLSGDTHCYYHARDRQRALVMERAYRDRVSRINAGFSASVCHPQNDLNKNVLFDETAAHLMHALELPLLEDANAISVTATSIMRALGEQHIDRKHAGTMFYGLQIVSTILKHLKPEPRSYRSTATADPEPLEELKAMLTYLREKKKTAASAAEAS